MTAFQIISYSAYLILTAEYNSDVVEILNTNHQDPNYFNSRVTKETTNGWTSYNISLTLKDWNDIKHKLKYKSSQDIGIHSYIKPLFLFGFQNIIEDQFSHETYNFVAEQNGYYSNTSNASYLEQAVTYLLDFGTVTYKTLAGGFDMFCYTLALELLNKETGIANNTNGGGIYLKHELTKLDRL